MRELALGVMTRNLCHVFYKNFENDPATFFEGSPYVPFQYGREQVDFYFDQQQKRDRIVFMIYLGDEVIGELKIREFDFERKECSMGIHLMNDSVKGKGYGTAAEKLALQYAFEQLEMNAVNAVSTKNNARSLHVMEKVGFHCIGESEQYKFYRCEKEIPSEKNHQENKSSEIVQTSEKKRMFWRRKK